VNQHLLVTLKGHDNH